MQTEAKCIARKIPEKKFTCRFRHGQIIKYTYIIVEAGDEIPNINRNSIRLACYCFAVNQTSDVNSPCWIQDGGRGMLT